jgi:hypothetical protein
MLSLPPRLTPEAERVLRALSERSIMAGSELMRSAGLKTPDDLVQPLTELRKYDLVDVAGEMMDPAKLPFTSIGIRPSNSDYIRFLLRSQLA